MFQTLGHANENFHFKKTNEQKNERTNKQAKQTNKIKCILRVYIGIKVLQKRSAYSYVYFGRIFS